MRLLSGFFGCLPNFQVHQHPEAFQIKTTSDWPWFYLRHQQLLLFFQDATHLVTKWRNRLLSSIAELWLGNKFISINHWSEIINNDIYSRLNHDLTKSDINPKDCQNFSSCLKLTSDDLFKILCKSNDTHRTLIYLQMLKMIIVPFIEKRTAITEREYEYLIYKLNNNKKNSSIDVFYMKKYFILGLRSAWSVVFFCRLWVAWIKCKTFNSSQTTTNNKSKYFITRLAYLSVEVNAHNLLYLILPVKEKSYSHLYFTLILLALKLVNRFSEILGH